MSLMQSIVNADAAKEPQLSTLSPPSAEILDGKKIAGSAILLAAVIILSSTIVLQVGQITHHLVYMISRKHSFYQNKKVHVFSGMF